MKKRLLCFALASVLALMAVPCAGAVGESSPNAYTESFSFLSAQDDTLTLRTDLLERVINPETAVNAVQQQIQIMDADQKSSPSDVDLLTLYAESAIACAARKQVSGNDITVNRNAVSSLAETAQSLSETIENTMREGEIETRREVARTVTLLVDVPEKLTVRVAPDVLQLKIDKIRIETPTYALSLKLSDLKEDIRKTLLLTAEDVGPGYKIGTANRIPTVKADMPDDRLSNPLTICLSTGGENPADFTVVNGESAAFASKFNPTTMTIEGKTNVSGTYTLAKKTPQFTDIGHLDAETQRAIQALASCGIINGTTPTTFSPDQSLKRSHFVALVMRGLGKVDTSAHANFKDVKSGDWYYSAVASSKQRKIIEGFADGYFHGDWFLNRRQVYTITGRILVSEMNYRVPENADAILSRFRDTVSDSDSMKSMIALSLREGLVTQDHMESFGGDTVMTRGSAALVLYHLFQRIW